MSDPHTRAGRNQQAARSIADRETGIGTQVADERERRLDLQAYARRNGFVVRWKWDGLPGGQTMPYLTRPGSEIEIPWPPGEVRR
jgi:hypothetical protein